jgi:GH35 family endo-1,4-beta-xylanase
VQVVTEGDGSKTLTLTAGGNANPWDSAFRWPIDEPLSNGEILWLRIVGYASAVPGEETGEMRVPTLVELQNSPYTRYVDGTMTFGPQAREQILIGEMTEDLAADTAYINMHLGGLDGTLHIESVELVRYPPGTDPADLPTSPILWQGMEPDAPWRTQAEADILAHRTDDLRIRVLDADGNPVTGATVTARQQNHAFAFGTAVNNRPMLDPDYADGPTYRQKLVENFEWATPENSLKWQAEDWANWEAGKTTADQGQATVDKIVELGLIPRGHVLLWPSYDNSPDALQGLDNATLATEIENRVRAMSAHYAGVIPEWDAVNEAFSNHDFTDLLGNQLLEDVFTWARAEDPDARFFINDFNILTNGNLNTDHKDFYYNLITDLQTAGVPLGGIGMQGHFGGSMPGVDEMKATLDRFASFGLPIRITEYDHDILDEQVQAEYLRDVLTLVFAHPAADGFFVWGFWDGRHWKDNAPFYRQDWSEKPALAVWQQLVQGEWWTGDVVLQTDAQGWVTVPAAFHGEYRIEVDGYDPVTTSHTDAGEVILTPPDPFAIWLEDNGMDTGIDPAAEEPGSGVTYGSLYVMGATHDGQDWSGILRGVVTESVEGDRAVQIHGRSGRLYLLQSTHDLISGIWEGVGLEIEGANNPIEFELPPPTEAAGRYYRVRVRMME